MTKLSTLEERLIYLEDKIKYHIKLEREVGSHLIEIAAKYPDLDDKIKDSFKNLIQLLGK